MPLIVKCPSCGKQLKVPDNLVGKPVALARLRRHLHRRRPARDTSAVVTAFRPGPRDRDDDLDEERPARRSRRDRGNYAPHRGGMILAFGIISLVATFTGVLSLVGLPLGIVAWILGSKDLKAIRDGTMDPEGQSTTQIGFILGIIGTILNLLWTIGGCIYLVVVIVIMGAFMGAASTTMPPAAKPMSPAPFPPAKKPGQFRIQFGQPLRLADYLPGRS